jgi:hypothetical protein
LKYIQEPIMTNIKTPMVILLLMLEDSLLINFFSLRLQRYKKSNRLLKIIR